jgi:hypothetical protein
LADGEDEVQHLAPVACHILAKGLELTLVVMDAAEGTHTAVQSMGFQAVNKQRGSCIPVPMPQPDRSIQSCHPHP